MLTILTKSRWHAELSEFATATFAETLDDLTGGTVLAAFGTGVIVPPDLLARYDRAYNFHAAPPAYPGRDPHHWAAYDWATVYGATVHIMTERVDAGPIVGVAELECEPVGLRLVAPRLRVRGRRVAVEDVRQLVRQ